MASGQSVESQITRKLVCSSDDIVHGEIDQLVVSEPLEIERRIAADHGADQTGSHPDLQVLREFEGIDEWSN